MNANPHAEPASNLVDRRAYNLSMEAGSAHFRLAELIAALSLAIDLGSGQQMTHVLASNARLSGDARFAIERLGLSDAEPFSSPAGRLTARP